MPRQPAAPTPARLPPPPPSPGRAGAGRACHRLRASSAATPQARRAPASARGPQDRARSARAALQAYSLALPLRLLELRLYFLRDLGQLGQDLDRLLRILGLLQARAGALEPVEQLLCALEPVLGGHAAGSFTILPLRIACDAEHGGRAGLPARPCSCPSLGGSHTVL